MTNGPGSYRSVLVCDADEEDWPCVALPAALDVRLPGGPLLDSPRNAVLWQAVFDERVSGVSATGSEGAQA